MTDPILNDLSRHMNERITRVIDDYFDRLQWSGRKFERDDIAQHLSSTILGIAAVAMRARSSSTLDDFLRAAAKAYTSTK